MSNKLIRESFDTTPPPIQTDLWQYVGLEKGGGGGVRVDVHYVCL